MADMIEKKGDSTASTAYGKKLDTPITYGYTWKEYPDYDTLKAAGKVLDGDEQVKVRNTEAQSTARQKALQAALDAAGIVKPTEENDAQIRLKSMFKTLMTAKAADGSPKYTEQAARDLAATVIGEAWAE